jgi:hypothetical protein
LTVISHQAAIIRIFVCQHLLNINAAFAIMDMISADINLFLSTAGIRCAQRVLVLCIKEEWFNAPLIKESFSTALFEILAETIH